MPFGSALMESKSCMDFEIVFVKRGRVRDRARGWMNDVDVV